MALQSPTTLLSSIQYMKSKLRNDKLTLIDIKNDFTMFAKKPRLQDESNPTPNLNFNPSPNTDANDHSPLKDIPPNTNLMLPPPSQKGKMLQLKKEHQREMARVKEEHERQMTELLRVKNLQLQDLENRWRGKLEEQAAYISILEDQVSSPIQTERQRVPLEQYDAIINKMLQENTKLHEANQQLTQECDRLKKICSQMDSSRTSRSRFRFAKGRKEDVKQDPQGKASHYVSEQSQVHHRRVSSVYLYNDENVDRSNFNQWEDIQIQDEEGGLKTIRQFEKSVLEDNHCRAKGDGYLSLKI